MEENKTVTIDRPVYVVAGLPRSGSTLLMNILGQNPRCSVTPTSGILGSLVNIRDSWDKNEAFRAQPRAVSEQIKINVLRSMLNGYMAHVDKPIFIDKNRMWLEYVELLGALIGKENIRLIITVRDLRDVLASFETRWRETATLSQPPLEAQDLVKSKTAIGRLELYTDPMQPVGRAFNAIRDAVTRGWIEQMHFVEYEALTGKPKATLKGIYDFLGEPQYEHDFDNIEQVTYEDDFIYGLKDLHTIRKKVAPQKPRWPVVFDKVVHATPVWQNMEKQAQFWRTYAAK